MLQQRGLSSCQKEVADLVWKEGSLSKTHAVGRRLVFVGVWMSLNHVALLTPWDYLF